MANRSISEIDKNFEVKNSFNLPDIEFHSVREEPFDLYGFYGDRNERPFKRLPDDFAPTVNGGVAVLYLNTSGGRVRFCTDSKYIAIHAQMTKVDGPMPHVAYTGTSGFDMYLDDPVLGSSHFIKMFIPEIGMTDGYSSIHYFKEKKLRYVTINFPTYQNVSELYIGLEKGSHVGEGLKYRDIPPVVYYGSSITQGGCCSKPGNNYPAIVSRRLNVDFMNLGFSGNGRGETNMVEYMSKLKMSAFVCDYDHNAPTVEHLEKTHLPLYKKIREENPDIPFIMLSRGDYDVNPESNDRRDVIYATYKYAREHGDKHVYFIDGASTFRGKYEELCTVEMCHFTDVGFALTADAVEATLRRAFIENIGW